MQCVTDVYDYSWHQKYTSYVFLLTCVDDITVAALDVRTQVLHSHELMSSALDVRTQVLHSHELMSSAISMAISYCEKQRSYTTWNSTIHQIDELCPTISVSLKCSTGKHSKLTQLHLRQLDPQHSSRERFKISNLTHWESQYKVTGCMKWSSSGCKMAVVIYKRG